MKYWMIVTAILFSIMVFVGPSAAVAPDKAVEWEGKGAGKVIFEGNVHNKNGLTCMTCHTKIFSKMGKDLPSANITMKAMYAGEFCGFCHNGVKAFSAKEAVNCPKCHKK